MANRPDYDAHSETDTTAGKCHILWETAGCWPKAAIMQSCSDAHKPTITQTFLESSAKQANVQLSHSEQRWHPLWSTSLKITMHWQKNLFTPSQEFSLWLLMQLHCVSWGVKSSKGKKEVERQEWGSDVAALRWNEALFAMAAFCRELTFINQLWSLCSPPFIRLFNNKTSSWGGRGGRNPIIIIAGPHGNSLTVRAYSLHSVGPNYFRPHITFLWNQVIFYFSNNSITKRGLLPSSVRLRKGTRTARFHFYARSQPISQVVVCTVEPGGLLQHISPVFVPPKRWLRSRTGPLFNCVWWVHCVHRKICYGARTIRQFSSLTLLCFISLVNPGF